LALWGQASFFKSIAFSCQGHLMKAQLIVYQLIGFFGSPHVPHKSVV
jgi:hypothetical protein